MRQVALGVAAEIWGMLGGMHAEGGIHAVLTLTTLDIAGSSSSPSSSPCHTLPPAGE